MDYIKRYLHVDGIIGQGAFGRVLVASTLQNPNAPASQPPTNYALKCVHPILKPQRLASELRYLRDLGGQCNVVQMYTAHFYTGSLFMVMDLIEHDRFVNFVATLDENEICLYMKNLLVALEHVHAHNIMHRDIKPANFLFNRKAKKFLLVDFGLAQLARPRVSTSLEFGSPKTPTTTGRRAITGNCRFVSNVSTKRQPSEALNSSDFKKLRLTGDESLKEPVRLTVGAYESPITNHTFSTPTVPSRRKISRPCDCRNRPRICSICSVRPEPNAHKSGTPGFKAPEVLMRYQSQNTAIDIWSAGVIFACLLSGHSPFFRDVDDNVSLAEIITVLGSHRVVEAANAIGIRLIIDPKREPIGLENLCKTIRSSGRDKRQISFSDATYELLNRMLDPNPLTRITASEALKHAGIHSE